MINFKKQEWSQRVARERLLSIHHVLERKRLQRGASIFSMKASLGKYRLSKRARISFSYGTMAIFCCHCVSSETHNATDSSANSSPSSGLAGLQPIHSIAGDEPRRSLPRGNQSHMILSHDQHPTRLHPSNMFPMRKTTPSSNRESELMVFTHAVNGRSTNIPTGAAPPKPSLLHAVVPPPSHYRATSMFLPCIDGHQQSSDHRHHVPTARTVHSDEGRQYPENSPSTHLGPSTTTCCNQHRNWNTNCHKNTGKGPDRSAWKT